MLFVFEEYGFGIKEFPYFQLNFQGQHSGFNHQNRSSFLLFCINSVELYQL